MYIYTHAPTSQAADHSELTLLATEAVRVPGTLASALCVEFSAPGTSVSTGISSWCSGSRSVLWKLLPPSVLRKLWVSQAVLVSVSRLPPAVDLSPLMVDLALPMVDL
jgi:hypothetical protein